MLCDEYHTRISHLSSGKSMAEEPSIYKVCSSGSSISMFRIKKMFRQMACLSYLFWKCIRKNQVCYIRHRFPSQRRHDKHNNIHLVSRSRKCTATPQQLVGSWRCCNITAADLYCCSPWRRLHFISAYETLGTFRSLQSDWLWLSNGMRYNTECRNIDTVHIFISFL